MRINMVEKTHYDTYFSKKKNQRGFFEISLHLLNGNCISFNTTFNEQINVRVRQFVLKEQRQLTILKRPWNLFLQVLMESFQEETSHIT